MDWWISDEPYPGPDEPIGPQYSFSPNDGLVIPGLYRTTKSFKVPLDDIREYSSDCSIEGDVLLIEGEVIGVIAQVDFFLGEPYCLVTVHNNE